MLVYVEIVRKAKQAKQSFSASDCTWAFQLDLQSKSKNFAKEDNETFCLLLLNTFKWIRG